MIDYNPTTDLKKFKLAIIQNFPNHNIKCLGICLSLFNSKFITKSLPFKCKNKTNYDSSDYNYPTYNFTSF